MKATELIAQLQSEIDKNGDLTIYLAHGPAASLLESIKFIDKVEECKMILERYTGQGIILE